MKHNHNGDNATISPGRIVRKKVAGKDEGGISHYRVVIAGPFDDPKQTNRKPFLTVSLTSKPKKWRKVEIKKHHWYADNKEVPKQNDISYVNYEKIDLVHQEKNGVLESDFILLQKSYMKPEGLDIIIDNLKAGVAKVKKKPKPIIQKLLDQIPPRKK